MIESDQIIGNAEPYLERNKQEEGSMWQRMTSMISGLSENDKSNS